MADEVVEPQPTRITGVSIDGGATFFDIDLDTITDSEAIAVEDAFGISFLEFLNGFGTGRVKTQKALVWLAMRRVNPALLPGDVVYKLADHELRTEPMTVPLPEGEPSSEPVTWEPSPKPSVSGLGNGNGSQSATSTSTSTISTS